MRPWHYSRIKIPSEKPPHIKESLPYQAIAGNWVFFFIYIFHDTKDNPMRESYYSMHTLGLDGIP